MNPSLMEIRAGLDSYAQNTVLNARQCILIEAVGAIEI